MQITSPRTASFVGFTILKIVAIALSGVASATMPTLDAIPLWTVNQSAALLEARITGAGNQTSNSLPSMNAYDALH